MSEGATARGERLAAALGDLLSREAVEALAGAGLRVRALQSRIAPLVAALSTLAADSPRGPLRSAIDGLAEKRRQNQALMSRSLSRLRDEIDARGLALDRLKRVRPAYGRQRAVATRLNVAT
ncbi:MAG TPA: hypothetical protein VGF85_03660 [Opitutaceae bacterium]|jgi:hypothetical protein